MKASDFFKTHLKDNNYVGYYINCIETGWYSEQFNCSINRESVYSQDNRKHGISSFAKDIYKTLASKTLSELNASQITFDEEFEANTDQRIFELEGNNFDDFKIFTNNIVGSIIYKSKQFNINCRFGNEFLQYMIANTSGFLELENLGAM